MSSLTQDFSFHHMGYATSSIDDDIKYFQQIGYSLESKTFVDVTQGIRGCFMVGGGPRIELLENLDNRNTLSPWLADGPRLYHFAYEVKCINDGLDFILKNKAKLIVPPTKAVAFDGRLIAFVMFRNRQMVELIEAG